MTDGEMLANNYLTLAMFIGVVVGIVGCVILLAVFILALKYVPSQMWDNIP